MPTVSFNKHLPGYEVLSELGRGNTRVLKARHLASGELVAIKQYAFAVDEDTLRRFERESQLMSEIDHPNIVKVREVQLDASMPFVVMDFVEGGDLRSLLRSGGRLDLPTTIRLGLQLTGAFRAIHHRQVVHRDVKPENVLYRRLISGELHFLLSDFGIAKFRADDRIRTMTGQSLMTYEYAAPEQFDNPRQVDESADYYALGVVLYECLTGRVPYVLEAERGLAQFMEQVLTAPPPAMALPTGEAFPPSLTALITALLTRDPLHRLRDADQLELLLEQSRVEQLRANRSGEAVPVSQTRKTLTGPVGVAAKPAAGPAEVIARDESPRNRAWQWWGIGGLIVAGGLGFGLYQQSVGDEPDRERLPTDTTEQVPIDTGASVAPEPEPVEEDSSVQRELVEEPLPEERPTIEPIRPVPLDSSTLPTRPPDSLQITPPDTTQQD